MKKKYLIYGLIVVISIGLISWAIGSFSNDSSVNSQNMPQYAKAEVQRGDIQVTASGTGSIESSVRKEVTTLNSGIVEHIAVEEGQYVTEGDLMLTFENDTGNTQLKREQLNVKLAENSLDDLREDAKNLKVYAPVSGVIGDIRVDVGDDLSRGYSLTTISDKSKLEVIGKFNKSQLDNIKVGDKAEVTLLEALQTITGTVTKIAEAPNAVDGAVLYEVTFEVDNPGGLASGMKVQITVDTDSGSYMAIKNSDLIAKEPYDLTLLTGGTLTKLNISSGDYVEKGDLLAELENTDLQGQIENQSIKVEQARLQLNDTLENLDNTAVFAPISGTILQINVTAGEQVRENTAVAVVSDLEDLEVVIPVDELDVGRVKVGQQAVVTVEAVPETKFAAEVKQIALEGKSSGGVATFDVALKLLDNQGLKPGMNANAEIISSKKENVLILPVAAIQQRGDGKFVITDINSDKQGAPATTAISIGLVSADYVEITEGLAEGDQVYYPMAGITSNQQRPGRVIMGGMGGGRSGGMRPGGGGR